MENRIGRPQLGNAFSKLFGLDDLNTIASVAPEVLPVASLAERPEYWALAGGRLGVGMGNLAAGGAGQFGWVECQNPTQGLLVIVERVIVANPVDAQVTLGLSPGVSSGTRSAFHRDARVRGTSLQLGLGANVTSFNTAGVNTPIWWLPGNGAYELQVVLPPLFTLTASNQDDNAVTRITFEWRERPALPDELEL